MSHEDAPTKRNVGPIPERGVLEAKVATLRNIVVRDCYETAEKLHMPDAMNRAEDFAQEAMMIALTKLDQYPDSGMTFPTWVKKIAINLVEGAAARKENGVTDQGEWDPNDTIGESHEWRSIHKVDGEEMFAILEGEDARIADLLFRQGLNWQEAAAAMNLKTDTFKNKLYRLTKKIREKFPDYR